MGCRRVARRVGTVAGLVVAVAVHAAAQQAPDAMTDVMRRIAAERHEQEPEAARHFTPCDGGFAGGYPCDAVDLLEFLPKSAMGNPSNVNDLWGWTDPVSGREFALVGTSDGTAFVEITDPEAVVYLVRLPTHTGSSLWRDVKTYGHYALVVSEASGHGMQVFDLEQLLSVTSPPVTFSESAHYPGFGNAHNVVVDEASGFAYAVGTGTCSSGLHMIDVHDPLNPAAAGCYAGDGYTHDAQCVVYDGPDADFQGHEICFAANEDTLTIVDVTDKQAPLQVSRTSYAGTGYTHQVWLTESEEHLLLDDELDEQDYGHNTRTRVLDVRDLTAPQVLGWFDSPTPAIDHNQYVKGDYTYQANYRSGLRILHLGDLDAVGGPEIQQVAWFDVYPSSDSANFNGAWSVYPYFPSGVVAVSHIEQGLFVLQPRLCTDPVAPATLQATPSGDHQIDLSWSGSGEPEATYRVERALGGCGGAFEEVAGGLTTTTFADTTASGEVVYGYRVSELDPSGLCTSAPSPCVEATTTGSCTAPPVFEGLASAGTPATAACAVDLVWDAGLAMCAGPVAYDVYRAADPAFVPTDGDRIASGVGTTTFTDSTAASGVAYTYLVRAVDLGNGVDDDNLVRRTTAAVGPIADGTFATGAEVGDPPLDTSGDTTVPPDAVEHVGWHFSDVRSHQGGRSFFSTSTDNLCVSLVAGPVTLSAGETSQLSFWTAYDVESSWDGGVVQIRPAGSGPWTTLGLSPDYPGSFNSGSDACGFSSGTPSFTGSGLTWVEHTASLAAWAGQSVELRWIYSTDGSQLGEGWYVDDIAISHSQVPGTCTSSPEIFQDGFESGGLIAWSGTAP